MVCSPVSSPGQVYGPGTWVTPFGDMGNTSTAWKGLGGRHAMARGVTHGSKERVHPAVPAIGREPSGAVPPVRDQPEDRLQMVGEGDWRGEGVGTGSIAASTYVSDAKLRRNRGGGF